MERLKPQSLYTRGKALFEKLNPMCIVKNKSRKDNQIRGIDTHVSGVMNDGNMYHTMTPDVELNFTCFK